MKYHEPQGDEPVITVTPFVGVWIEMHCISTYNIKIFVTPFVGVWIEIKSHANDITVLSRHSLCGSVD